MTSNYTRMMEILNNITDETREAAQDIMTLLFDHFETLPDGKMNVDVAGFLSEYEKGRTLLQQDTPTHLILNNFILALNWLKRKRLI